MKVTVLGATGFIGSWAVRALVADRKSVTAIVRPESDAWRLQGIPNVRLVRAPLQDWPAAIAASSPETLLTLDWAGVAATDRDDEAVQRSNLERHSAAVAAALEAGASRVIGTGSQAEYGVTDGKTGEDHMLSPTSAYGHAKVAAGAALVDACAPTDATWVWARIFSVFGPLESGRWLLPSIARSAFEGSEIALSSGSQPWSYLYAADAARALAMLVANPSASGVYNIAHPDAPPLRESIAIFAEALGAERLLDYGVAAGAGLEADVTRLEGLGWHPLWDRHKALTVTAAWHKREVVPDPFLAEIDLPLKR